MVNARAIGRLVLAVLWLAICSAGWALARPFGGERAWSRRCQRGLGWAVGLRVRATGTPIAGNALFVANHISWLDILALGGAAEVRFIAKSQIARWPLVGTLTRMSGGVFVSRERRSETRVQADAVAHALTEGQPVVLFAEGGTGSGQVVRPFRAPLFAAAVEAGVPVQPVAIDYGPERTRFSWADGASLATEACRMLGRPGTVPVTIHFLPPLDPEGLDRKALAAKAQVAVAAALS